jgi:hypothetical protein
MAAAGRPHEFRVTPQQRGYRDASIKRLEAGRFRFPPSPEALPRIEVRAADLVMLLEGIDLSSVKRGKRYHRPVARATV